jgi:hypothetical protein
MGIVVFLREFVDQMDVPVEASVYLNRLTGKYLAMTDEDIAAAESDDPADDESLPDWQRELMSEIREAIASDDWLALPSKFDIDEYRIMEAFSSSLAGEAQRRDFLDAIRGSGAFRRFKQKVHAHGIEKDWYQFRDEALRRIAVDWLEANEIAFAE